MKTLLFATDFSAAATHAAAFGFQLAKQIKADVVLCNAFTVPAEMPEAGLIVWPLEEFEDLQKDVELELSVLQKQLESAVNSGGYKPKITHSGTVGRLTDVVDDLIASKKIYLIVMATHGKGLSQFMLGNHSRSLIDTSSKPLLLIPPSAPIKAFKKIAFATDLAHHKEDLEIISRLIPVAKLLGADILVTHIRSKDENPLQLTDQMARFLNDIAGKADYPNISYSDIVNVKTETGLDWLTGHGQIDMLVMVHRPQHFLDRLLNGSHTQKMAAHIPIPLLVFPSTVVAN